VEFCTLAGLRKKSAGDPELRELVAQLVDEVPIHENPSGIPSLWYIPIVGSENFFDGFGFNLYKDRFGWEADKQMEKELEQPPDRPLLPFLEQLASGHYPQRWDPREQAFKNDDDWLLLEDALGQGSPAE